MEISPELLLILNQSHPTPCVKPYFNEDPVKVITGVVHHGALNIPYPNVFTSFPDLSQEEQIIELDKRIIEVQSNHNINMNVPPQKEWIEKKKKILKINFYNKLFIVSI